MNLFALKALATVCSAVLLFAALIPDIPYGYYVFLRWIVAGTCVYRFFTSAEASQRNWMWFFGALAVLFNPIIPVRLDREIWQFIDVVTGICLLVSLTAVKRDVPKDAGAKAIGAQVSRQPFQMPPQSGAATSREKMSVVDSEEASHVFAKRDGAGNADYKGSYINNPNTEGGTAIFGKDATATTIIQMCLMHMSDKLPDQHKTEFCQWAQLPTAPWSGKHRSLYSLACISVLQDAYRNDEPMPAAYETLKESFIEMDVTLPSPLTDGLRKNIRAVLLGR